MTFVRSQPQISSVRWLNSVSGIPANLHTYIKMDCRKERYETSKAASIGQTFMYYSIILPNTIETNLRFFSRKTVRVRDYFQTYNCSFFIGISLIRNYSALSAIERYRYTFYIIVNK